MGCTLNTGTMMVISGTDLKNQMFDGLYFEHWYTDGDLRYRYQPLNYYQMQQGDRDVLTKSKTMYLEKSKTN